MKAQTDLLYSETEDDLRAAVRSLLGDRQATRRCSTGSRRPIRTSPASGSPSRVTSAPPDSSSPRSWAGRARATARPPWSWRSWAAR
ncbi:hypothetical protein STANM309S_06388 [Streptomyces tanashiensis]